MPEIPYTYDHITPSDSNTNQTSTAISPVQAHGLRPSSTSDDAAHRTLDYAYRANPASDTVFCNSLYSSGSASNPRDEVTPTPTGPPAPYRVPASSTNAAIVPNLNLASFGSQPWPTTSAPYLEFAPQPVYEPTGELVHESVQDFQHFDDPSSFGQTTWRSEEETIAQHKPATAAATSTLPSPSVHKDAQSFPKPALKRPLESDAGPDLLPSGSHQPRPQQPDPRKVRKVSFERMSAAGPVSADDEDSSSSSEAPSSSQAPSSRATPQTGFRGLPRRGRGTRASNAPPPQRTGHHQFASAATGTASRPPNPTARGNKTPSGHPPSILPPEKVFPIQIGSELFRLSGASISSDGQLQLTCSSS